MSLNLKHQGGLTGVALSGMKVAPDEIDRYEVYQVVNPSVDPIYVGTAVGTQTTTQALGLINTTLDYPRNLAYAIAAAAGSVAGGTLTANGVDQFGSTVTESVAIAPATGGGTTNGTAVFARVSSGTAAFGTGNPGNGTARLGVAITPGTKVWFGLPAKIASTTDVKLITTTNNGTSLPTNGGSIGANVSTTLHAIQGTIAVAGTQSYTTWFRPTFSNNKQEDMANLR